MSREWTLEAIIERALSNETPSLGLSDEEARHGMDLIAEADLGDPRVLEAYDVLHNRVTYGRAY